MNENIVTTKKSALVLGAGGFIGSHMVRRLKNEGYHVRGVDLKLPEYSLSAADEFVLGDLTHCELMAEVIRHPRLLSKQPVVGLDELYSPYDEIYQFAADMGGAGYIFTGDNDAKVMQNSATINLNLLQEQTRLNKRLGVNKTKIFYSSSACIYPAYAQEETDNPGLKESDAYPAWPDSEYGWEKLFSERLYMSFHRNHGIPVRVARYHNIYGPEGTWCGGKEKAPAAICRKVAELGTAGGEVEVWGDGEQTRSFLFVSECIEATRQLMQKDFLGPINIGSEEMVSINQLVDVAAEVANKSVTKRYKLSGPTGVRGRNSENSLIREKLAWDYAMTLKEGIAVTYNWIEGQLRQQQEMAATGKLAAPAGSL